MKIRVVQKIYLKYKNNSLIFFINFTLELVLFYLTTIYYVKYS